MGAGVLISRGIVLSNPSGFFFFFPYFHIGGAEKVHGDILACFAELRPWVIITRRSVDDSYRSRFEASARLFNLWWMGFLYPLSIGLAAGFINRHRRPVVFGCNSPFFYYLVPYLATHVRTVDLTHAFDGLERLSLTVARRLDARVVIHPGTIEDFRNQYQANDIPPSYLDRVRLIENCVDVPGLLSEKATEGPLRVLYVGRGTVEKRVHLVGRVAAAMRSAGVDAVFTLVGRGIEDAVEPQDRAWCTFTGEIGDREQLASLYRESHLLLLTSSREGFPLVIMEAMAHGVVPICTDVGGISGHVVNGENGFLVPDGDEEAVVGAMADKLGELAADRQTLDHISAACHRYARAKFSSTSFREGYRQALLEAA